MPASLKQAGDWLGHTWQRVSEGWHELFSHTRNALTHYSGKEVADSAHPRWSLLAGEVEETDRDIVVTVELPGMEKKDCRIAVEDGVLYLSGEKHYERDSFDSTYHMRERAYGAFRRAIPLPVSVDAEKAVASYKNGVLCVRIPKAGRAIPIA